MSVHAHFTDLYDPLDLFMPSKDSVFISGLSVEERSEHVTDLQARATDTAFVEIVNQQPMSFDIAGGEADIALRSERSLEEFWLTHARGTSYLDITGLSHQIWASLVAAAVRMRLPLRVVYVEPKKYRFKEIAAEGELFDLSKGFSGIAPLPGFASLAQPDDDETLFVPLLGFEGQRYAHMLEEIQPLRERVIPVIGVPGFRPEFVFYAYHGNKGPLSGSDAWQEVRYATANCPFNLVYLLEYLLESRPNDFLKVAPIGTKPHGLGAALCAIAHPDRVEIVYDHPVRRDERTRGKARLLVYHLAGLYSRFEAP
jgi:hypothetical protein